MLPCKKIDNSGFTFIELLISIFILSMILVFLLPNLVNEYKYMKEIEKQIEMRMILYEEIIANKSDVDTQRGNYKIIINKDKASIKNIHTNKEIIYE